MPAGGAGGFNTPTPRKSQGTSVFMSIAVVIFITSLGAVGGMFFWKSLLISQQETYKTQLAQREKQFDTRLMQDLKQQDVKINFAQQLLRNHLSVSNVFAILGSMTIENVRFLSLDLTAPANSTDDIKVTMKGYATSFSAVAFQSQVLASLEDYDLRGIIKNPILSDPSLDNEGTASFGFSATIDSSVLSYEKTVTPDLDSGSTTPQ